MKAHTFWQHMNVRIWWAGAWINDRGWDWYWRFKQVRVTKPARWLWGIGNGIQRLMENTYTTERYPIYKGDD